MNSKDKERLEHIDECMKMLGISLNLTDPEGSLSSKKYADEHTAKMWNAVNEDYRKLSDAILALRKDIPPVHVPPWARNGGPLEIE